MNPLAFTRPRGLRRQSLIAQARHAEAAALQGRVKFLLGEYPVTTCDYIWYYNFARQVHKVENQFLPEKPKPDQHRELLAKYLKMGLKQEPLLRILKDVFYLDWPAEEPESATKTRKHEEGGTTADSDSGPTAEGAERAEAGNSRLPPAAGASHASG